MSLLNDSMTLDEKLEAIDKMLSEAVATNVTAYDMPVDPASLLTCEGCQ